MPHSSRLKARLSKLHRINPRCTWCGKITNLDGKNRYDSATIDHLNSRNDFIKRLSPNPKREYRTVLSCYKCNNLRGQRDHAELSLYIRTLRSFGNVIDVFPFQELSIYNKLMIIQQDARVHRASCLYAVSRLLNDITNDISDENIAKVAKSYICANLKKYEEANDKNERVSLSKETNFWFQFLPKISDKDAILKLMDGNIEIGNEQKFGENMKKLTTFFRNKLIRVDGEILCDIIKEKI